MNTTEIKQLADKIKRLLKEERLIEAIELLKIFIENVSDFNLSSQYEQMKSNYVFTLKYWVDGVNDPKRNEVIRGVYQVCYSLLDECVLRLSSEGSHELFYIRRASVAAEPLNSLLEHYRASLNKLELLLSVDINSRDNNAITQVRRESEQHEAVIFNKLWCMFPLPPEEGEMLKEAMNNDLFPEHFKALILSALFLGLTKFYDEAKLEFLLQFYGSNTSVELQIRALTCAVIAMYLNRTRIMRTSSFKEALSVASSNKHFKGDVFSIVNRLIRTKNTDNITRRMKEDLMPDIMNMSPEMLKKIKGSNNIIDPSDFEANPEWQEWLENSGISKKMQELNRIQTEGGDVYISTFANLKSYPFFNTISNWFLPFYPDHSMLPGNSPGGSRRLVELIGHAPFLCNSDKYSLMLSLASIPDSQREMVYTQFDAQNESIKELKEAELEDEEKTRDLIVNCLVQDLYRFFKLFSRHRDFVSVFETAMDFTSLPYIDTYVEDQFHLSVIAEFYLANGFYEDAIKYYELILRKFQDVDFVVYQKIGFAHQNLNRYDDAIVYYQKYDIVNDKDVWNLRHIASCCRALKDYDKALVFLKRAENLAPENPGICLTTGHCLLEKGNIDEALQYYFKVDYLEPHKHRAWKPIAWCSFLKNDYEQSEKYYRKILDTKNVTTQDYLNYGHLLLCQDGPQKAIEVYRKALETVEKQEDFIAMFEADRHYLLDKKLRHDEISLARDAVINTAL